MSTTTTYSVVGMTCDHCVKAVTDELTSLAGVTAVDVSLADEGPSQVTVTSNGPLEESAVAAAVDEAGYELAST
jgi:copper chaperone